MAVIQYFAYGSNMLTERLKGRCDSARPKLVAAADDRKLAFSKRSNDGSGKATLAPAAGCRVFGVVFDLDQSQLPELDRFEGAGRGYDRDDDFEVSIADSVAPLRVVTYIANHQSIDPALSPYDWYLDLVVAGARQHALPPDYIARLETTPGRSDPQSDRPARREAMELLEKVPFVRLPYTTHIAGQKTVADWVAMKARLTNNQDPAAWEEAFNEFFKVRLETRYFAPIKALENMKKNNGEGFAIVALHCTLIEFLATTIQGKTFRDVGKAVLKEHEYGRGESKRLFVQFLKTNKPFDKMFSQEGQAEDFFSNVRCGLLHEAQTRAGWRIRVCPSTSMAINASEKVVCRDKMQQAFDQFLEWYKSELAQNCDLQKAFIRKFNSLCEE